MYELQDLGFEQGHYVAFTKEEDGRSWYLKDDTSVEVREEFQLYDAQADQSTIYIMFY